jgi:hypothetical protein
VAKIRMLILPVIMGFLLAGCAADPMVADQTACDAYGFKFGTPQFAHCVMKKEAMRNADKAPVAEALLSNPTVAAAFLNPAFFPK